MVFDTRIVIPNGLSVPGLFFDPRIVLEVTSEEARSLPSNLKLLPGEDQQKYLIVEYEASQSVDGCY